MNPRQFGAMPRLVPAFLCGAAVGCVVPRLPGVLPLVIVAAVLVAASMAVKRRDVISGLSLYLAVFAIGAARVAADRLSDASVPIGESHEYCCVAINDAVRRGKTVQFDAVVTGVDGQQAATPFKIKVSVYSGQSEMRITGGASMRFRSVLTLPPDSGGKKFDYRRYLLVHGYKAQTFVFGNAIRGAADYYSANSAKQNLPLWARLQIKACALRRSLGETFVRCGIGGDNLAVVYAMTLGDKRLIVSGLRDAYSVAGASHVLALSGLHLGIIYSVLIMLLGRCIRLWRWRIAVQAAVLLSIWAYVVIVGMPVSAVRSALMLSVGALVMVSGRTGSGVNALFVSAFVVVLLSPQSLFDVGFQMSFLAVASILAAAGPLYRFLTAGRAVRCAPLRWLAGMASVSIAAQIGVAPLTAYCFGRFSCYFLFVNVFAIPLATLLLYGAVAMLMLSGIPFLQQMVALAMDSLSQWLNGTVNFVSSLPGASVENIRLSLAQLFFLYVLVVLLFLLVGFVSRRRVRAVANYRYPDVDNDEV